ncbi:hypothetical protein BEH84_05796 [Eisenbergiella tayi]|uniref:Uncharacterized protein n=1 Tax=Eisenbergiella tayi TaxID=1432052 RepID=A0A1E3A7K0_9FIRM|nr:hypothetical protein BEH84_05796 [Eisenbergiella tayi]
MTYPVTTLLHILRRYLQWDVLLYRVIYIMEKDLWLN